MTIKKFFITIFAVISLLTATYYLGYFLVLRDFLPDIAKSAGSLIKFDNNVEIGAGKTLKVDTVSRADGTANAVNLKASDSDKFEGHNWSEVDALRTGLASLKSSPHSIACKDDPDYDNDGKNDKFCVPYGYPDADDCNDWDNDIYPGHSGKLVTDGKDNDCDGVIDNLTTIDPLTCEGYRYLYAGVRVQLCKQGNNIKDDSSGKTCDQICKATGNIRGSRAGCSQPKGNAIFLNKATCGGITFSEIGFSSLGSDDNTIFTCKCDVSYK